MLEPGQLRFRHGDTLAELKIPYHLGGEDEAVIEKAVLSLIALFMKRYEYAGKERGLSRIRASRLLAFLRR